MTKTILLLLNFIIFVNAEGYYCPYQELGANGSNNLLYDYYTLNQAGSGTYWTRTGETGWQTVESYCSAKGDLSIHSDAGEWKCNDSKGLCNWDGSSCKVVTTRGPDCIEMCRAVLNGEAPDCLGNCPDGHSGGNYLYDRYCNSDSPVTTSIVNTEMSSTTTMPTSTQVEITSSSPIVEMTPISTRSIINEKSETTLMSDISKKKTKTIIVTVTVTKTTTKKSMITNLNTTEC